MKPIRESIGREMRWHRTRFLPAAYELRVADEAVATLEWPSLFGSAADAATADGSWRFRREALFSLSRTIEDSATGTALGRYVPGLRGGKLQFADESSFRIGRDRPFGPLKVWREDGGLMLTFARRPIPSGGRVELEAPSSSEPRLGLLVTFGFYLLTLKRRRAARSGGG